MKCEGYRDGEMSLDMTGEWFISYWPYHCSHPASTIKMGKIKELIKQIEEDEGTVIFFYPLYISDL